jgi:D-alanyl-D-alanine carboxypeptidase
MLIESLTGNSLKSEIENRILNPLELNNTGFLTSGVALPGTHGRGYYAGEYEEDADVTEYFDISWAGQQAQPIQPRESYKSMLSRSSKATVADSLHQRRLMK